MRYIMLIDSGKCLDCKACILACQQRNNVPYGYSRNWVNKTPDTAAKAGVHYQPGACMHCENPPCVSSCPTLATYQDANGAVVVDEERCIGCGNCIDACPYHARFRHPVTGVADKCDYCQRSGGDPACVSVCPVGCRVFGDVDDQSSAVAGLLASRKAVYVRPAGYSIQPNLTYLDKTVPAELPAAKTAMANSDRLGFLADGLSWAGGGTLLALGAVWLRQRVRPSTLEDEQIEKEHEGQKESK